MARSRKASESKERKNGTPTSAFCIVGEIVNIFEGKNADYLTIKSARGDYYDLLTVDVPVDLMETDTIEDYNKGDMVQCTGFITSFFDKTKKVSKTIFTAAKVSKTIDTAFLLGLSKLIHHSK